MCPAKAMLSQPRRCPAVSDHWWALWANRIRPQSRQHGAESRRQGCAPSRDPVEEAACLSSLWWPVGVCPPPCHLLCVCALSCLLRTLSLGTLLQDDLSSILA